MIETRPSAILPLADAASPPEQDQPMVSRTGPDAGAGGDQGRHLPNGEARPKLHEDDWDEIIGPLTDQELRSYVDGTTTFHDLAIVRGMAREILDLRSQQSGTLTQAVQTATELRRGIAMIHDALSTPSRPRQSVGEVTAWWLDYADKALSLLPKRK